MAKANFKIENLDALGRARDRVAALRDGGNKVVTRAIGTLKRKLPTWMKRDIAQEFALKQGKISARLRVKADANSVTLTALGRNQTLGNFPIRQTATGVRAEVRNGRPVEVPHAFMRVPAGIVSTSGPQAFIRDAAMRAIPPDVYDIALVAKDKHGYPIRLLGGPSVAMMMTEGDREDRAIAYAQDLFAQEIDRLTEATNGR